MGEFAKQLSSYNLLNYLLTGVVFVALAKYFTTFSFVQSDIVIGAFVYYFIGLLVSRIGSVVLEPLLKRKWFAKKHGGRLQFLKFAPPEDFVFAASKNPKVEILSEQNNVYRSLLAAVVCVIVLRSVQSLEQAYPMLAQFNSKTLIIAIFVLLLRSYQKQTNYVRTRVEIVKKLNTEMSNRLEGQED
jgi:hypothetical protein